MEIKGKTIGTGKPLLCVPVMESNKEEIIDELWTLAKSEADIVEWRIDTFVDYKNYSVCGCGRVHEREDLLIYIPNQKTGRHGRTRTG